MLHTKSLESSAVGTVTQDISMETAVEEPSLPGQSAGSCDVSNKTVPGSHDAQSSGMYMIMSCCIW